MTSYTEQAIAGLVSALTLVASGTTFPVPSRNEGMATETKSFGTRHLKASFNIWDGEGSPDEARTLIGGDVDQSAKVYELNQRPLLELIFEGGNETDRASALDAALIAIDDELRADRTLNGALGTDGAAYIEKVERAGNLATDGMPGVKGAVVTVLLIFTSNRPF